MNQGSGMQARRRLAIFAGVCAAAAGAQVALAAPPVLESKGGLLVLPNVRVERSSQPVDGTASAMGIGSAGVRAYKDHETGQLRKATPEELVEEAKVAAPANNAAATRVTSYANGRKSGLLDESFMSYSVVRRGEGGKFDTECVTGETAAQHALHGKSKEHRHAH